MHFKCEVVRFFFFLIPEILYSILNVLHLLCLNVSMLKAEIFPRLQFRANTRILIKKKKCR